MSRTFIKKIIRRNFYTPLIANLTILIYHLTERNLYGVNILETILWCKYLETQRFAR